MKQQITRVSFLQSSKIVVFLYFIFGFLYTIPGLFFVVRSGGNGPQFWGGLVYCLMPVLMAIIGFVGFGIFCAIYNTLAKLLGGIEFEVTTVE